MALLHVSRDVPWPAACLQHFLGAMEVGGSIFAAFGHVMTVL